MHRRLLRFTVCSATVVLGILMVYRWQQRQVEVDGFLEQWGQSGLIERHTDSHFAATRQTDPFRARLMFARALLADSLDLERLAELPPAEAKLEAQRVRDRLALTQEVAANSLALRPSSWESATLLGGARLMGVLAAGDDPIRHVDRWEASLELARNLSPRAIEPRRFLTVSHLTRWHALSETDRTLATQEVRELLGDTTSLRLLLPAWMAIADRETLFESLPESTLAWSRVSQELARQGRWSDYCDARDEWARLQHSELQTTLAEAIQRRRGGDVSGARQRLLQVVHQSVPGLRSAKLLDQALSSLPPGPISPSAGPAVEAWADWGLALWLIERPSLSQASFRRLAGNQDLLPPVLTARAWLAAGDLQRAEAIEQRLGESWSEDWAPYLLGKARVLAEEGRLAEAKSALEEVHRSYRRVPAFLELAERLDLEVGERDASNRPSTRWPPTSWSWKGRQISMTFDLEARALEAGFGSGLEVVIDTISPEGSPIEFQWDGKELGCRATASGDTLFTQVDLEPGLHRLQLLQPTNSVVQPGTVSLRPTTSESETLLASHGSFD